MKNRETETNAILMRAYDTLREGGVLHSEACLALQKPGPLPHQKASLIIWLLDRSRSESEDTLLKSLLGEMSDLTRNLYHTFGNDPAFKEKKLANTELDKLNDTVVDLREIITRIKEGLPIGSRRLGQLVTWFVNGLLNASEMALWLAAVCRYGLSQADTVCLTQAMASSGSVHDYRKEPSLIGRRLIRRYPTGGLSEKAALILPALIAAFADQYPVATPFLVARSLGFTGGTWDKLMSIPGFTFPDPGEGAITALNNCHCAMVVSKDDCNPADRLMYQLRSVTGTVRSIELAAASIASKQVVFPVHRLLLDVRYGPGAFFSKAEAKLLAETICKILEESAVECDPVYTKMEQPNGTAIGNALEVMEAIAIITNKSARWNTKALKEQFDIVIHFFSLLMSAEFPNIEYRVWSEKSRERFKSGKVRTAFIDILKTHGVTNDKAEQILDNPEVLAPGWFSKQRVVAEKAGTLRGIDQKTMGYIVNFELGGGGNQFTERIDRTAGIIIHKRLNDNVCPDDILCEIVPGVERNWIAGETKKRLYSCFDIS